MRYPTFNRAVESPELQRGIALAAAPEASMGDPTLPLWGSFMVPRDEASEKIKHDTFLIIQIGGEAQFLFEVTGADEPVDDRGRRRRGRSSSSSCWVPASR